MQMTDIPVKPKSAGSDRSLGAILIDSGVLKPEDAERILRLQKEKGLRFGEAAVQLGLVSDADMRFALAAQFEYPYLQSGKASVDQEVIAAYQPFAAQVEALRAVRSQLMLRWFTGEAGRHALVIVSPGRGDGRSWLAANLAVVFSQLGEHTLLIDGDLRHPRQHKLFGVDNRLGLSALLSGREDADAIHKVPGLRDLSVLTAGAVPPNPQELLCRQSFGELLARLGGQYDVVIVDSPAGDDYADAQLIAGRCGGALLVARQNSSRIKGSRALVDAIAQTGASVVGATYAGA